MKNKIENTLKNILQSSSFKLKVLFLKRINEGGCSQNYICVCPENKYLIKLIEKNDLERAKRLSGILKALEQAKDLQTAYLAPYNAGHCFEVGENLGMMLTFLEGRKLTPAELNEDLITKIAKAYQSFKNIEETLKPYCGPQRLPEKIYKKNILILKKATPNFLQNFFINQVAKINHTILLQTPSLSQKAHIIHGDASLNNMLINGKDVALLDFEMIRFGHTVEDAAELMMDTIFKHRIFFFPQKKLKSIIKAFNNIAGFSKEEWLYGISMHYLYFIQRRLRHPKFVNSWRKKLIFLHRLKTYHKMCSLLDKIY